MKGVAERDGTRFLQEAEILRPSPRKAPHAVPASIFALSPRTPPCEGILCSPSLGLVWLDQRNRLGSQ